ncbi:MAG: sigma 54-interacting transcriptional regulator, partial [Desulfovibrionaceae bacterium]
MAYDSNPFFNVDRERLLSPQLTTIWDHLSLGVVIVDANGVCCYMNKLQRSIDGFDRISVVGEHITKLYLAHQVAVIPTLECMRTGKPLLKKVYWYKTTKNQLINSFNDFFPLFSHGQPDGVISFTSTLGSPTLGERKRATAPRGEKKGEYQLHLYKFSDILGKDKTLQNIIKDARTATRTISPVMIWGESGSGKELFAQAIHTEGDRSNKPFIPINCAAIPENLLEGMLFGTSKGSFTDATEKAGLFEEANGGTLVFDELNSMPLSLQAKLLRVIQEKRVRRLGAHAEIPVDVRVISILNEHPLRAMEQGRLRRDLYYRLAVVGLPVPPLRLRRDDILRLAQAFIDRSELLPPRRKIRIDSNVANMFLEYNWPGNIRELQHVIEGTLALLGGRDVIYPDNLPRHFYEAYTQAKTPKA